MLFTTGNQPCVQFRAKDEGFGGNIHECFGPYPVVSGVDRCSGCVSFCSNCHVDHHSDGWDTCPQPRPVEGDVSPRFG